MVIRLASNFDGLPETGAAKSAPMVSKLPIHDASSSVTGRVELGLCS